LESVYSEFNLSLISVSCSRSILLKEKLWITETGSE